MAVNIPAGWLADKKGERVNIVLDSCSTSLRLWPSSDWRLSGVTLYPGLYLALALA